MHILIDSVFRRRGALVPICCVVVVRLAAGQGMLDAPGSDQEEPLRVATFNVSLNRSSAGELIRDLSVTDDQQARTIAEIIQRVRPQIILLNEFDYDEAGAALQSFQENYLSQSQGGAEPIEYPFIFAAQVNTGVPSGVDLDRDGTIGGPNDAFGFGRFPGQYGMALLSQIRIQHDRIRTFQQLRWSQMPGALLPDDPDTTTPGDWYSTEALEVLRLSSKSHWDVPVAHEGRSIHILCSHPTPPAFDGPEDRNGRRNHDEIRFWIDYISPSRSKWIVDDAGRSGGLAPDAAFVILGDLNSDPNDGGSLADAINDLLHHQRVASSRTPNSAGALEQARLQRGANDMHVGGHVLDTADFKDDGRGPGNLRVDYVLPSRSFVPQSSGVYWPRSSDPQFRLVGTYPFPSSDHRLVWMDLVLR